MPRKKTKVNTAFMIKPENKDTLKRMSEITGESMSSIVDSILDNYLEIFKGGFTIPEMIKLMEERSNEFQSLMEETPSLYSMGVDNSVKTDGILDFVAKKRNKIKDLADD